jgi:hypothetical protein
MTQDPRHPRTKEMLSHLHGILVNPTNIGLQHHAAVLLFEVDLVPALLRCVRFILRTNVLTPKNECLWGDAEGGSLRAVRALLRAASAAAGGSQSRRSEGVQAAALAAAAVAAVIDSGFITIMELLVSALRVTSHGHCERPFRQAAAAAAAAEAAVPLPRRLSAVWPLGLPLVELLMVDTDGCCYVSVCPGQLAVTMLLHTRMHVAIPVDAVVVHEL